ncbi:hypothetical protein DRQ33_04880 [bacterium]|nr:MAG: hypothetical protein DRQ33_04880 [bacterium]
MKRAIIVAFSFVVLCAFISNCAGKKQLRRPSGPIKIPKIESDELLNILLAQDTVIHCVRLSGRGIFRTSSKKQGFRVGLVSDRIKQRLGVYLGSGMIGVASILWLCHPESICIYVPIRNYVMVEPIGYNIEGIVLPPKASVMIDMFSGLSPLARFSDYLTHYEQTSSGYYLTFQNNNEALVILATPQPCWHIDGYQWIQEGNPGQIVDVQFPEGELQNSIWVPNKVIISAPTLDQEIEMEIDKYLINPEISDSLFEPNIPDDVNWWRAY